MKGKICSECEEGMNLKCAVGGQKEWDLFFQCGECGKLVVERKKAYINKEFNKNLK